MMCQTGWVLTKKAECRDHSEKSFTLVLVHGAGPLMQPRYCTFLLKVEKGPNMIYLTEHVNRGVDFFFPLRVFACQLLV